MSKLITVDFHDDTLFALETHLGVHVAIKPISDRLDLPMVPAMAEPPEQGDFGFTYTAIPTAPAA